MTKKRGSWKPPSQGSCTVVSTLLEKEKLCGGCSEKLHYPYRFCPMCGQPVPRKQEEALLAEHESES